MKVSSRLSWGFKPQIYRFAVIYSTCWGIQNSFSYCCCCFFAFRLLLECVINRLYRRSFVLCWKETPDQFKLVFKPAIWVTKQQGFTHDESCLPDQVRIVYEISKIHEVWLSGPKSIKLAIFKCRYQIYNWNFVSKLMENCKYILITIIKRGIFGKEESLR